MNDIPLRFRRAAFLFLVAGLLVGGGWIWTSCSRVEAARPMAKLNKDVDGLFEAFQQYKEHVGRYPEGSNAEIAKALFGKNPKNVIILVVKKKDLNPKGELVDPWGTPLKIYFSANEVLIRSAGPNKFFEDSKADNGDDYFRSD